MKTVEEIKADIAKDIHNIDTRRVMDMYRAEITSGIPLDRLEQLCQAERDGRCVLMPCKVGDTLLLDTEIMGCSIGKAPFAVDGIEIALSANFGCTTQSRTISLSEAAVAALEAIKSNGKE